MPIRTRAAALVLLSIGIAITPGAVRPVQAQGYPFSQRQSISQHVAFTTISLEYGRPVARGRKLFGALVPWDSIWHPGADSATRVTFDHDLLIDGHKLAAGEYTLWLVPREQRPWTLIFSRAAHVFHKPYPGAAFDVLHVDVKPEPVSHVETLTIDFPLALRDSAELRIHWGETAVVAHIKAPYRPE